MCRSEAHRKIGASYATVLWVPHQKFHTRVLYLSAWPPQTLICSPTRRRNAELLAPINGSHVNSIGLHVNFIKSFLVPINVDEIKAKALADTFGCKIGAMPFTYLGLSLGTTRPSIQDFTPLLSRIESMLGGISNLLSLLSWKVNFG